MTARQNETMIYAAGSIGFILGFLLGQLILLRLLKGRSAQELVQNKKLKWTYGVMNWAIAGAGAYVGVTLFSLYGGG